MRNLFVEQLKELNVELITMGALCEEAISAAVKALLDGDESLLEQVFAADEKIDRKEREIESLCMKLLLRQQPVARDLRAISSALKMISDMERIGDQASDIGEIVRFIKTDEIKNRIPLREMATTVIGMVTDSIDSFVKKDLELARRVVRRDDEADDLFRQIKQQLIALITEDSARGECGIDLLMTAKYLERIGDHAVNIAEWVEYSITGVHEDA